jgi:hypothetical protein
MATKQEHATDVVCGDCRALLANGEWPCDMTETELADYENRIINHPNYGYEMTLGHLHDASDSNCWHAGQDCEEDCDCARSDFARSACGMCGTTLVGNREDVTLWWNA